MDVSYREELIGVLWAILYTQLPEGSLVAWGALLMAVFSLVPAFWYALKPHLPEKWRRAANG